MAAGETTQRAIREERLAEIRALTDAAFAEQDAAAT